jgi:hypothetical protein
MPTRGASVKVEGLASVRRTLRATDTNAARSLQATLKDTARIVAEEAGRLAPRGTLPIPRTRRPHIRLFESYRPSARGNRAYVRSALVYAPIKEFRRTGTVAEMRGVAPVQRAMDQKQRDVQARLVDGFDDAARLAGWRHL